MDEDVAMDEDSDLSKAEGKGDGLDEYNLEDYDDDDGMPGMYAPNLLSIQFLICFSYGSL